MKKRGRRHHKSKRYGRRHNPKKQIKKASLFKRMNWFSKKHPIATAVLLIALSLILFRLSFVNDVLKNPEVSIWIWIISTGLGIAGILVLIGWWRNHISMLTTRHNVDWRGR